MSKCTYRKQRGAGIANGTGAGAGMGTGVLTGFNSLPKGAAISGVVNSQAAMFGRIPSTITEQGMNFSSKTAAFHRSRKNRSRRQRGGALAPAPYSSLGETLPSSMTGGMTTDGSGGSATGVLDTMLAQTRGLVQQSGGGYRSRSRKQKQKQNRSRKQKQNRSRKQKQNRNRNRQSRKQKQRGGALGFGPAVPASGDYSILSPQELKAAGLNPQFFDENLVNPAFGGAIVVPGGKLN